jgi:hypothetical protein
MHGYTQEWAVQLQATLTQTGTLNVHNYQSARDAFCDNTVGNTTASCSGLIRETCGTTSGCTWRPARPQNCDWPTDNIRWNNDWHEIPADIGQIIIDNADPDDVSITSVGQWLSPRFFVSEDDDAFNSI